MTAIPIRHRADVARVVRAIDRLLEAQAHRRRDKATAKLVRALATGLRRAFRAQERDLLKRLVAIRGQFDAAEAARAALTQSHGLIVSPSTYRTLQEASEPDWEAIFDAVSEATRRLFTETLREYIGQALLAGGEEALLRLATGMADVSFDLANPRAVAYAEQYVAELVTQINEATRADVRRIITQGVERGDAYNKVAKELRQKYQEFHTPSPLNHIKDRAELIAVTEMGNAYEAGNEAVVQELADAGLTMEKSWLTVGDSRVSEHCQSNQAAGWIAFDDEFPSGHQRPLAHPGCRCTMLARRKPSEEDV